MITPDIIYHYCDCHTLIKILETRTLLLSSSHGVNDYLDTRWIDPLVSDRIKVAQTRLPSDWLEQVRSAYEQRRPNLYIACFSSDGDILSQWRAYSADGEGFAIGFHTSVFSTDEAPPSPDQPDMRLVRVLYDQEEQIRLIDSFLNRFSLQAVDHPHAALAAEQAAQALRNLAVRGKNPKFREEKEWRLVYRYAPENSATLSDWQLEFRVGGYGVVPYFLLPFCEAGKICPMAEVVIGPKNETLPEVLAMMFKRYNLPDLPIRRSEASYR